MLNLSPEQAEALVSTEPAGSPTPAEIRIFALSLLARREYAVLELQSRLLRKWVRSEGADGLVAAVVDDLRCAGLVSDERFAASFIRSRMQRLQGPVKISNELRSRQVPEQVVSSAMLEYQDNWVRLAADWLHRHAPAGLDYPHRAKYYRRLIQRGFTHEQAVKGLAGHTAVVGVLPEM